MYVCVCVCLCRKLKSSQLGNLEKKNELVISCINVISFLMREVTFIHITDWHNSQDSVCVCLVFSVSLLTFLLMLPLLLPKNGINNFLLLLTLWICTSCFQSSV